MAKSKYAPALFEVIGSKDDKSSGKLTLPKWWKSKAAPTSSDKPADVPAPQSAAATPSAESPADSASSPMQPASEQVTPISEGLSSEGLTASTAASLPPVPTPARPPAAPPAGTTSPLGEEGEPAPLARVEKGRLVFSLNQTHAIVAAAVILLGLFVMYEVGRGFGRGPQTTDASGDQQTSEFAQMLQGEAKPDVISKVGQGNSNADRGTTRSGSPAGGSSAKPKPTGAAAPSNTAGQTPPAPAQGQSTAQLGAPPPSGPVQRTPGLTYVVIESFNPDDKQDAEHLRTWLKNKKGIDTTLEGISGNRWQVVSTKGFDYNKADEKAAGNAFRDAFKAMGKEYKAEFGSKVRYDMREPGLKKYVQRTP